MNLSPHALIMLGVVPALCVGAAIRVQPATNLAQSSDEPRVSVQDQPETQGVRVHYLEVVTASVDETCKALAAAHGIEFSQPIPELGNARTADLDGGGRVGVRAPMHGAEKAVVRPYVLVDDIQAAVKAAEAAGAQIMVPPMPIPGQGTCSIYILGGVEHGLWQR